MWMRSATSKTCGMLWLIRMTGRPRARTSAISSSTWRALLDAQRGGRLVHDDDAAAEGGGAGNGDALALAAGQRLDRLVDVLDRHEAEGGQLRAGLGRIALRSSIRKTGPSGPGLRSSRPRNRLSAIDSAGESARFWYTVSMPALRASIGVRKATGLPSRRISPASGIDGAGQRLDQRRLAGAVVADDAEDLAARSSKSAPSSATTRP